MQIKVTNNDKTIFFELNNSEAAKDLLNQLPMTIKVENYSNDEKIFYPTKKLSLTNTPASQGHMGDLAYYAPWGDVVMFYREFSAAPGLYNLGECVTGADLISSLSGTIEIEQA